MPTDKKQMPDVIWASHEMVYAGHGDYVEKFDWFTNKRADTFKYYADRILQDVCVERDELKKLVEEMVEKLQSLVVDNQRTAIFADRAGDKESARFYKAQADAFTKALSAYEKHVIDRTVAVMLRYQEQAKPEKGKNGE